MGGVCDSPGGGDGDYENFVEFDFGWDGIVRYVETGWD
jgi:hypothetical protein